MKWYLKGWDAKPLAPYVEPATPLDSEVIYFGDPRGVSEAHARGFKVLDWNPRFNRTAWMPALHDYLLTDTYIILPAGSIRRMAPQIRMILGGNILFRDDTSPTTYRGSAEQFPEDLFHDLVILSPPKRHLVWNDYTIIVGDCGVVLEANHELDVAQRDRIDEIISNCPHPDNVYGMSLHDLKHDRILRVGSLFPVNNMRFNDPRAFVRYMNKRVG